VNRIEAEEPDDYEKVIYDTIKGKHPFWDVVNFENSVAKTKLKNTNVPT
jgi:hypothetical protein